MCVLSTMIREWFGNGSRMVRQMCAVRAILRGKCVNCLKSLKSLMQIFATFASAIFVGKESNESTVRYALWSRISLTKPLQNPYLTLTRFQLSLGSNLSRISLASLICLCMLTVGVGNAWGATYNLVTDVSSLSAGDVILIVSPAGSIKYDKKTYYYNPQSMTSTASGVRLGCTEVTISSTSITSTTAEEWTLSGSSGSWKLNSGNKYLYATAKNQLSTTTTPASGLVFGLAIDNDNKAWFTVTVGSDACKLQMNTSYSGGVQTYFALYTSNQKPIYIYKKVPSCTPLGSVNGSVSRSKGKHYGLTQTKLQTYNRWWLLASIPHIYNINCITFNAIKQYAQSIDNSR